MPMFRAGRRKKVLVDARFQLVPVLTGLCFIIAVTVFLALPLLETMRSVDVLLEGRSEEIIRHYKAQQTSTIASISLFVVGIVVLWTASMLWQTQRIAGPIVKITRYVHQFAAGNFEGRIQLREKDEMKALANALNDMADGLEERDRAMRSAVLSGIDSIKRALYDAPTVERAAAALDHLAEGVRQSFEARREAPVSDDARQEPVHS